MELASYLDRYHISIREHISASLVKIWRSDVILWRWRHFDLWVAQKWRHAGVERSVLSRSSLYHVVQTYRALSYLSHALTSMFDIFDNIYDGFYVSDFILYQWVGWGVASLLWAASIHTSGHLFEKNLGYSWLMKKPARLSSFSQDTGTMPYLGQWPLE